MSCLLWAGIINLSCGLLFISHFFCQDLISFVKEANQESDDNLTKCKYPKNVSYVPMLFAISFRFSTSSKNP